MTGDEDAIGAFFRAASDATSRVANMHEKELSKTPILQLSVRFLGSLLHNAAQKLIDKKQKTGDVRAQDEAIILSCSRLFYECFAGYELLRRGLVLQAIVLLRSAFEVTAQAILLMERGDLAERWLSGKKIAPREVRSLSRFAAVQRHLYKKLSALSHPNIDAIAYHTVPLPSTREIALAYGGWFGPKSVGQITTQFLFAQLVFLETLYTVYENDLDSMELLWRAETIETIGDKPNSIGLGWKELLSGWRKILTDLMDHFNSLPSDSVAMALHLDRVSTEPPSEETQSSAATIKTEGVK